MGFLDLIQGIFMFVVSNDTTLPVRFFQHFCDQYGSAALKSLSLEGLSVWRTCLHNIESFSQIYDDDPICIILPWES